MSNDDLQELYKLFEQLVDLNSEQQQTKLEELRASGNPHAAPLKELLELQSQHEDSTDHLLGQLSERIPLQQWLQVDPYSTRAIRQPTDLRELVGLFRWDNESKQFYAGDYRIGKCLAFNSHTATYFAEDRTLGRKAVITFAFPRYVQDAHHKELFLSSAKLVSDIAHPNVVTILGVIQQGQLLGIARQWIPGQDLNCWLEASPPLSTLSVALLLQRIAEGLAAIHRCSILHGDLKPANIIIREDRATPVITDFGTVFRPGETDGVEGVWRGGTPGYIAPEVLGARQLDERVDLFSLGKVLGKLLEATADDDAAEMRLALEQLRDALTNEDPEQRPANAADVIQRLVGLTGIPTTELRLVPSTLSSPLILAKAKLWTRRSVLGLSATVIPFYTGRYLHQQQLENEGPRRSFIPGYKEDIRSSIRFRLDGRDWVWSLNSAGHPFRIERHDSTFNMMEGGLVYTKPGVRTAVITSERFRLPSRVIRWSTLLIWAYYHAPPGAVELRIDGRSLARESSQPLTSWELCARRRNYFGGSVRRNLVGTISPLLLRPDTDLQFRFTFELSEAWSGAGQPPLSLVVQKVDKNYFYVDDLFLWYEES